MGVQGDFHGGSLTLHGLAQKGFRRIHVALPAQLEIDRLPGFVHRSIQVHPFPAYLYIGLVHPPGSADLASEPSRALLEFRRVKLKYQRTHRATISQSKWLPLNSSSTGTNRGIRPSSPNAAALAPEHSLVTVLRGSTHGCPTDPAMNRRPPQMAIFFGKLISCPWKAGVPAASQTECDMNVAGTRTAKSASAIKRGKTPKASPNPAASSNTRAASIITGTKLTGAPRSINFLRGNGLVNDPEAVEDKHDCNQNTRRNHATMRERAINRSLKLVSRPQLQIINVAPWRGFLQELAGVKDTVVRLEIGVAVDLPFDLHAWPIAYEPGLARAGRNKQEARNCIDSVVHVLSSVNKQVGRDRYRMRLLYLNPRK